MIIIGERINSSRKVIAEAVKKRDAVLLVKETKEQETMPLFDNISPLDFRYYGRNEKTKEKLKPYLSEEGAVRYLAKVEAALTKALAKKGICSKTIAE